MTERKRARPSGRVCISGVRIAISGHRKAFHDQMKVRMTLVAIADFDSGSRMRTTIRHSLSPSTRAASISERGTASKLALKMKMQMMVESSGRATPELGVEHAQPRGDQVGGNDRRLERDQHARQAAAATTQRRPGKCLVSA